ncbi:MAG: hypothetical protein ACRENO_06000 [Thermodesulfobacteriota bacterium]
MNKVNTGSNEQIYFTIIPTAASGLSDKLNQFNALYRFGRSLGFTYYHTNFKSFRSSNLPLNRRPSLSARIHRAFQTTIRTLKFNVLPKYYVDIFDYLGFNQFFRNNTNLNLEDFVKVEIKLSDDFIFEKNIGSSADLKNYINNLLYGCSDDKKLLIFNVKHGRKVLALIYFDIPKHPEQFGLRNYYLSLKNKQKFASEFDKEKLKVLVHIRRGDTSIVKTPWNTFISVWLMCKESKEIADLISHKHVDISEYNCFLEKSISYYGIDKFSTLIFSDGFKRAFSIIYQNNQELN